jgi:tripartite motif-containing protein 71
MTRMSRRGVALRLRAWVAVALVAPSLLVGISSARAAGSSASSFTSPLFVGVYAEPAGVAPLYPAGGDADGVGNIYIADSGGDRVVRIDEAGTTTVVLDHGLDKPRALALDADGASVWVLDTRDNQIVQVALDGTVLKTFGGGGFIKAAFGIATDVSGVYVADTYHNRVIKVAETDGHRIWAQGACGGKSLSRPRGVTVGSDGNVYAADTDHGRIVVLDPSTGACIRIFGSAGSGNGQFAGPRDLVSDAAGGLWVAEAQSSRIQHVTNAGAYIAKVGSYGSGPGKFRAPACVFMGLGAVDVCDTYEFVVQSFSVSASGEPTYLASFGGVRPVAGGFNQPFGVAYDGAGRLYVTDMFNQRAQVRDLDGTWREWGGFGGYAGSMQFPRGIAVAADGTIVLTNSENNRLDLFTPSLALLRVIKPQGTSWGWPHQTALVPDGTYWVADTNDNRVMHVSATGAVLVKFSGSLRGPSGVALDSTGNVFVANRDSSTVQKYSPSGTLLMTVATAGSGPSNVRSPWNLTIAGPPDAQVLYVADGGNGRVLAFATTGELLGSFGQPGSGDAQLSDPRSVAVDPTTGTIAVADFGNNRITLWSAA